MTFAPGIRSGIVSRSIIDRGQDVGLVAARRFTAEANPLDRALQGNSRPGDQAIGHFEGSLARVPLRRQHVGDLAIGNPQFQFPRPAQVADGQQRLSAIDGPVLEKLLDVPGQYVAVQGAADLQFRLLLLQDGVLLFEVANHFLEFFLLGDELAVAAALLVAFVAELEDLGLGAGQAPAGRLQLAPDLLEFEIELRPPQFGQDLVGADVLSVLGVQVADHAVGQGEDVGHLPRLKLTAGLDLEIGRQAEQGDPGQGRDGQRQQDLHHPPHAQEPARLSQQTRKRNRLQFRAFRSARVAMLAHLRQQPPPTPIQLSLESLHDQDTDRSPAVRLLFVD